MSTLNTIYLKHASSGSNNITLNSDGSVTIADLSLDSLDKIKQNQVVLGLKLAATSSLAKYALSEQIIDDFQDLTGVDTANSTNEVFETGQVYGTDGSASTWCTGGTVTEYNSGGTDYRVHSFLSGTNTFTVPVSGTIDILAVAGGGAGGAGKNGSGGGAGGMIATAGVTVTPGSYSFVVGAGGTEAPAVGSETSSAEYGGDGEDTTTGGITATAVGGGAAVSDAANHDYAGRNGGSGGGGGENSGTAGTGVAGQGNAAGSGPANEGGGGTNKGQGGGGAGEVGNTDGRRAGGDGLENAYRTGSNVYYAGGGSAGMDGGQGDEAGGLGGGGVGKADGDNRDGGAGTANTGGGGGGGGEAFTWKGGAGGSGIIVVRYNKATQFLNRAGGNLTLQSTATTATTDSNPDKADIYVLIENTTGTATAGTDVKAEVSRNNGTNWTDISSELSDEGAVLGTNQKLFAAHNVPITSATGTAMKYKIKTLNQVNGSKVTKIRGVSFGWK